jgi:hypothetical protein
MFLNNKYTKIYFQIITKAQSETRFKSKENYFERHHIIPKSFGGSNKKNNLVLLTAKEHFICHLLLPFMCEDHNIYKMRTAFYRMCGKQPNTVKRYTSKSYHILKTKINRLCIKENHPTYGKKLSIEHKEKIKFTKLNNGTWAQSGENHWNYGKTTSKESNIKRSVKLKGKISATKNKIYINDGVFEIAIYPDELQKYPKFKLGRLREYPKGESSPFYGKTHTDENKLKMSLQRKGIKNTEETKIKKSLCKMGEKNWHSNKVTNGEYTFISITEASKVLGIKFGTLYQWVIKEKNGWKRIN